MTRPSEDAVVKAARREASLAFGMWAIALLYTVTYCYLNGYGRSAEDLTFVLWLTCVVMSVVFAFGIMGDESLGEEADADPESPTLASPEVHDA